MGLVQLFRDWPCREFPCPEVFARHLLDLVLADFYETGHHHLMMLVAQRDHARQDGPPEEVVALDRKIHEHTIYEQLPKRWDLDYLFSRRGYEAYGNPLFAVWATVLIQICILEQHWERAVLGLPAQNPALLPGFHSDEDLLDTGWLEEARQTWSADLRSTVLSDAARLFAMLFLPAQQGESEAEPEHDDPEEVDSDDSELSPWLH